VIALPSATAMLALVVAAAASPFRTTVLTVTHTTDNSESLVLQGADLLLAWSALINKSTGALTVSIADRQGSYVVFARCKDAADKPK
jgi:hypothetical protein